MNKISLKKNWRELFFSLVMSVAIIIACALFAKSPSMSTFAKGCFILAISFVLTFFFCGGHSLPDEERWKTFSDTVGIFLGLMCLTQAIIVVLACFLFDLLTNSQCFSMLVALLLGYSLTFVVFVILICDDKKNKFPSKNP